MTGSMGAEGVSALDLVCGVGAGLLLQLAIKARRVSATKKQKELRIMDDLGAASITKILPLQGFELVRVALTNLCAYSV